jgi:hypothetical protein
MTLYRFTWIRNRENAILMGRRDGDVNGGHSDMSNKNFCFTLWFMAGWLFLGPMQWWFLSCKTDSDDYEECVKKSGCKGPLNDTSATYCNDYCTENEAELPPICVDYCSGEGCFYEGHVDSWDLFVAVSTPSRIACFRPYIMHLRDLGASTIYTC